MAGNPNDPYGYAAAFGQMQQPGLPQLDNFNQLNTLEELPPPEAPPVPPEMRKAEAEAVEAEAKAAEAVAKTQEGAVEQSAPDPALANAPLTQRDRRGNYDVNAAGVEARAAHNVAPMREARSELARAQAEQVEAERVINAEQAEQKFELAAIDQEFNAQVEAMRAEHAIAADERLAKIEGMMNEAAQHRVKPGRLWNTDTGTKLAGGFAAFIGGFLSAGGVQNGIQGIIDRGIERDINAQLQEKQDLKDAASGMIRLDAMYTNKEEQAVARKQMGHMARRAALITEFEGKLLQLQDPVMVAKGKQIIANQKLQLASDFENYRRFEYGIAERQVARKQQTLDAARARAAQAAQARAARRQRAAIAARKEQIEMMKMMIPTEAGVAVTGPDGKQHNIVILDEKQRREAAEIWGNSQAAWNMLEVGKQDFSPERLKGRNKRAVMEAWISRFIAAGNGGKFGGQFSDKDAEQIAKQNGLTYENGFINLQGADEKTLQKIISDSQSLIINKAHSSTAGIQKFVNGPDGMPRPVEGVRWQPRVDTALQKRILGDFGAETTGGQDFQYKTQDIESMDEAAVKEALVTLIKENPDPTPPKRITDNMDTLEKATLRKEWNEYHSNLAENRRKNLGALTQTRVDALTKRANELGIREIRVPGRTATAGKHGLGPEYLKRYGERLIIPEIKRDYGTK